MNVRPLFNPVVSSTLLIWALVSPLFGEEPESIEVQPLEKKEEVVDFQDVDLKKAVMEKRVEKLGLLSSISDDVSAVWALTHGDFIWSEFEESAIGKLLLEVLRESEGEEEQGETLGRFSQLADILAEEFIVVVGEGTVEQTKNLVKWNEFHQQQQIRTLFERWASGLDEDDNEEILGRNPFGSLLKGLDGDSDFLVNILASAAMPPVLLAARISDEETREKYGAYLQMGAGMALGFAGDQMPYLKPSRFEASGVQFAGIKIDGEKLIEHALEERDLRTHLELTMDPATAQDLITSLAEKDLLLAGGVSGEALYLYLGSDEESVPLVKVDAASLVEGESFSFVEDYLDEKLLTVLWMKEELVSAVDKGSILGTYVKGLQQVLKGDHLLGKTDKLEALLERIAIAEEKYLALNTHQQMAAISFARADGLYIEGFGGVFNSAYDFQAEHQMNSSFKGSFLTAQSVCHGDAYPIVNEYIEATFQGAYELTSLLVESEKIFEPLAKYVEGFQFFDEKMKEDVTALWAGLKATKEGLGRESVLEVDLQGSWPTMPNIPQVIIDESVIPRVSLITEVQDRAQLAESWTKIEASVGNLFKIGGEFAQQKIPQQKPMSSQNDELTTWFFPIPMQTDDFVPSVTLNDQVAIFGTSKNRAVDLAQAGQEELAGQSGILVEVSFSPLQELLKNWLEVASKYHEQTPLEGDVADIYTEYKEEISTAIKALAEFESWTSHTRLEGEQLRSSAHLKTR